MPVIDFRFNLNANVTVTQTGRPGKVVGLYVDREEINHALVESFSSGGERATNYFREEDIELANSD